MNKVLLINEEIIKKYTLVNDNIDGKYLLPAISTAQETDLDTILGTVLNNKLQTLVANNTIGQPANANYKNLLDNYVIPYLCWQVMSVVQIAINYKFTNSGVIQNSDERKQPLGYNDNKALQSQYDRYASAYAQKLQNYLIKNVNIFPEYLKSENYQFSEDPQLCDIFLEDIPYRNRWNYKYK